MKASTLRRKRLRLGLSQSELGEKLGVHAMTVSRWERGVLAIPRMAELAMSTLEQKKGRRS